MTEDVAAAAVDVTSELAARLKSIGCRFALRDFGLMLGALTLARLASKYDPPGFEVRL